MSNATWKARGLDKVLHVIQKGALFGRFLRAHGAYLPHQLEDFRTFLELITRNGADPAEKAKASQLIEHMLPEELRAHSTRDIARAATSIILLTAYITGPAAAAGNHWGIFEYWVLAASYVLHLGETSPEVKRACLPSFSLCERAADEALRALAKEAMSSDSLLQGLPLIDSHVYKARITILLGLVSALALKHRISREPVDLDAIRRFLRARLCEADMWGESAIPYLFLAALEFEQHSDIVSSEGLIEQLARDITTVNGVSGDGRGYPSPYYSPESAIRLRHGLDPLNAERFVGFSYTLKPLVHFLVRRLRRRTIAKLWEAMTRISLFHYRPATPAEWFRWNSPEGVLESELPGEPQSWSALLSAAQLIEPSDAPAALREQPAFALSFILVYPHRFTSATAKLIEDSLQAAS